MLTRNITYILLLLFIFGLDAKEESKKLSVQDSILQAKKLLEEAKVRSSQKSIRMTIRNVDISTYPEIKLIVEAYNIYGEPLDTLLKEDISVLENGSSKSIISVEKISIKDRIPVDFCFVVDQTGSMQPYIDAMEQRIINFTNTLHNRGIDYTLSLVLFSDKLENFYQPTGSVGEFLGWLRDVKARGGNDIKENCLAAIKLGTNKIKYRPSANKVLVIITDAPYHQAGENGAGKTDQTTESIIKLMNENEIRAFCITSPKLGDYELIANKTRGNNYDMDYPFSSILDNFSNQLTNLYAIKYKTLKPAIPDSIDIGIVDAKKQIITQKTIPIVELGRKLIIENMLFGTGKSRLPKSVKELNVLNEFMANRENVVILIEGHTDNVGSYATNDRLSLKRANAVKKYLINKGISPLRIKTKGYGERRPIASNNSDWGKKLNRRTEIIIIAK
ncbi:OmpA family protein [Candidatus Kapabacteria bacterium]|nr:OmpA family protein [Candidatus Kapabacteria bacterium]